MSDNYENSENYLREENAYQAGKNEKRIAAERNQSGKFIKRSMLEGFRTAAERCYRRDLNYNLTIYSHFILRLLCLVLFAAVMRVFVFEPTFVDGESMQNTLMDTEHVLVEKISYWFEEPKRGDIVIVHYPNRDELFVKRVIALGGETIKIDRGYVYINDEQLDESEYAGDWYGSIYRLIRTVGSENGSYTVPYGCVFVMGDNRNESHDSRAEDVGAIPIDQVVGKAQFVIWPIGRIRYIG